MPVINVPPFPGMYPSSNLGCLTVESPRLAPGGKDSLVVWADNITYTHDRQHYRQTSFP